MYLETVPLLLALNFPIPSSYASPTHSHTDYRPALYINERTRHSAHLSTLHFHKYHPSLSSGTHPSHLSFLRHDFNAHIFLANSTADLASIRLSRRRRKKSSTLRPRRLSTPPPSSVTPPPPILDSSRTFPVARTQSTPRCSYRSVQALFEEIECADYSIPTTSRLAKSQVATPPAKKPDPTKCNRRDRAVVRKLFQELQDFPNRPQTTRRPISSQHAICDPEGPRRATFQGRKEDAMPKENDFHHHVSESSETELASEVVTEIDQPSEMEQYEVYRYEPGSASGPTEAHVYKVEDDGDDVTTTHHHCDHRDEHDDDPEEFQTVDDSQYDEKQVININEHYENDDQTEVQGTYRDYQEQVYDGQQEQAYEEHTETNRDSATTANSFDEVAKEMAQDLQVLDRVGDSELRNLVELIPERNQDRLFSEDEPPKDNDDGHERVHEIGKTGEGEAILEGTDFITEVGDDGDDGDGARSEDSELPELPRAPPSFVFRTERLSKNVADAMANVWDRFWSEDVKQISGIIKNRFSQLLPYIRRFLAHLVAFWGGITYLRRALTAFVRILNRDERIRELLERVGWASATTVKVFLSICGMVMQATLQMYYLMRNKIIPDTRRVIPIVYYKAIVKLLKIAENSPWSLVLGPFSLTFAIDSSKIPDRYFLHHKLSVPQEDVTFASAEGVHTLVQSVRESIHRTRYGGYGSQQSTPVHTQTTDELPYPPPSEYTMSQFPEEAADHEDQNHHHHHHHHTASKHGKETVSRYAPLTERTNHDAHNHV